MIYIAQLLCPNRHCIMATALEYHDDVSTHDVLTQTAALDKMVNELFKQGGLNRHCGICGSTVLFWEQGKTKFKTKEEALEAMKVGQGEQLLTRAMLDMMGISFDAKQTLKNN